jgi:hypothetical protein
LIGQGDHHEISSGPHVQIVGLHFKLEKKRTGTSFIYQKGEVMNLRFSGLLEFRLGLLISVSGKFLLGFASRVILDSWSRRTHDHIFLSHDTN